MIYTELLIKKSTGVIDSVSMSDIANELNRKGYTIETVLSAGSTITGITLDNTSVSVDANGTATIKVTYEGNSNENTYYAVVGNKYYKIVENPNGGIKIEKTATDVNSIGSGDRLAATVASGSNVIVDQISGNVITLKGGSTYGTSVVRVSYGSFSKDCAVTVVIKPTETSVADSTTTFSTSYGTIEVIWLSGTSNNVTSTPNEPVLESNGERMTPVTWTYNSETKTWTEDAEASSTWYNYVSGAERNDNTSSMWANAKTDNGSYFVWIPRYAYRITYYSSKDSTTPTGYYDGLGMWNASNGTKKYALESGIETVEYNGNKYIVHPAFCDGTDNGYENGEWDTDLSGFWFAKYEMSGSGTALKSVPDTASLRSTKIGDQYVYARQATYGYTGTSETLTSNGTDYTYTSFMKSHLVKNSEWGAAAYLTQSQYGRNGNDISVNQCTGFITGAGRGLKASEDTTNTATGTSDIYNGTYVKDNITPAQKYNGEIGVLSSTTGNVYGIYDMSGGAWERAAAYDKLGSADYVEGSSYGLNMTQEAKDSSGNYTSTKYITAYSNGEETYSGTKIYTVGKTGDSTRETYAGSNAWFSDSANFAGSGYPFFARGGGYNSGANAGVFYSSNYGGHANNTSFRAVLCP